MLEAFFERKGEVKKALSALSDVAEKVGAKSLRERVERDLVKKLDEDRFHLVVVGEFNHGKSSFVNALLGEGALAVGVTPTTAAIHHLKYAEAPEAQVVYASGRRETIPFADAKKFAVGGPESPEKVDFLEIGYPAPILKERILLVDTPGVNDLSLQRSDITYSYIPRADAVLFLLDAGQILKESERIFLQDKLLKASRDKIVFVITKWDILSAEEQTEALHYAKTQLANLVKDPLVFPISAETALAGKAGESGMPELLAHLTTFLAEERGRILLDNALGEGVNVGALLAKGVDAKRRAASMKTEELLRRISMLEQDLAGQAGNIEQRRIKIREEVAGIKVGARKDLDRFVEDTIRQLPNVIDGAKQEDLKQYLPAFLEDTFKKWAEAEAKEIGAKLEDLAERTIALVREDANETTKRVIETLGGDVKRLDVQVDTFRYDAGIAALFAVGLGVMFVNVLVGGLLTLAAPVLALVLRDRIDAEYKKRAKELAPDVVRQAAEKAAPKLDEMIDDFAGRLDAWVVTAGEELHREVLEVLSAAKVQRETGEKDVAQVLTEVETQQALLDEAVSNVERIRASLWQPDRVRIATTAAALPPQEGPQVAPAPPAPPV
ncbi:MAG: dynamin family protein [Myxococcales bacterium]|nr:dynamin family protein [Myxococcales bacterium]